MERAETVAKVFVMRMEGEQLDVMDGMSMDLERANMDKLRSVFPECFAEGKDESVNWRPVQ